MRRTAAFVSIVALSAAAVLPGAAAGAAARADQPGPSYVTDPAGYVNPVIGTSGAVDDFPGADSPFGMVQWSPDTTPDRPSGGGYEYQDGKIRGFSLTHVSGPGCGVAGDVPILPTSGSVGTDPGGATLPLDHSAERASAGDYRLTADGIRTELTTTLRSGMGSFTFPQGADGNLLFKLTGGATADTGTHFQVVNDHEVAGWVHSGKFCGGPNTYALYFDMVFNRSFSAYGTWHAGTTNAGDRSLTAHLKATKAAPKPTKSGRPAPRYHGPAPKHRTALGTQAAQPPAAADGGYVTFDTASTATVQAKVGISYVSTANAKRNRVKEDPGWNLHAVAGAAHAAWNRTLRKIRIAGGSATDRTVFYTALYHALLHPNVFSDVNRQYMGFDGQVHKAARGHVQYANYSGWDIYRSQVQLAAMVAPKRTSDSIRSMLNDYDQSGMLPKWASNNGESYVMVGDPADPIIADAYAFGARDFNTGHALRAMRHEATHPNNVRPGLNYYLDKGYLPVDGTYGCCNFYGPVSTQQEYDVADDAVADFAATLGHKKVARTFRTRAQNWQNTFNPGSGYFEPKYADGRWLPGFNPGSSSGFVEGDSYQYTPMVPFDLKGLIAAGGGRKAWVKRLDALTENVSDPQPDNANLGNEPSIEIPWEYDYAGAPYKTQGLVREIQQQIFPAKPAGIAGNDDLGTMSAWYVWSALGMYPETPGTADLAVGSPVFPKAQVRLPSGRTLTVTAPDAAPGAPYVRSMRVNGASWSHAYLRPSLLSRGGTVDFTLGTTPNTGWATGRTDAPPSHTAGLLPALGYTDQNQVVLTPGESTTIHLSARNLTGRKRTVSWTARSSGAGSSSGPTVGPSSGTFRMGAHGTGGQAVTLKAPTDEGRYTVTFTLRSAGKKLPDVVVAAAVAKPGELWPYYNNAGVADDGVPSAADFDGDGWAYSAQQLATDGVSPGKPVTSDGYTFTWPDTKSGELDNIIAGGQTIAVPTGDAAHGIGLLGSATNAGPGSKGTATVHYADGSSEQVTFGFSDWTLGAGGNPVAFGNTVVADTPYRDTSDGDKQQIHTYLFSADAPLTAGKTPVSVTLPSRASDGELHVFAIAFK